MHDRTKKTSIPPKIREEVEERDNHCCIFCGSPNARGEAHFVRRSQGGMGIPQNLLTVCRIHHRLLDESDMSDMYKQKAKEYLKSKYPGWNEEDLVYNKWKGLEYD